MKKEKKVLMIDNFDSFTYNLVHYLQRNGGVIEVVRNNDPRLPEMANNYTHIVVSPGPSTPSNSGWSPETVKKFYKNKKILGVCLGMQIINEVLGGKTVKAPYPVHGKTCRISITEKDELFADSGNFLTVARYHSLICSDIPEELQITAEHKGIPMAFKHKTYPLFGVQFHPESFLTPAGEKIIKNFLNV